MSAPGYGRAEGQVTPETERLRLAGYRLTDLNAAAGAVVWLAALVAATADAVPLSPVDRFVALAVLVLVPLGLGLVGVPDSRIAVAAARAAAVASLPAALAALAGLALPVGSAASVALALPWLAVTGAIAVVGVVRLRDAGTISLPELAVSAACLYVPVGAVALVLHRAGVFLRFEPIIVLLTAVHYHYAGFVLPLAVGLLARVLADGDGFEGVAGRVGVAALLVLVGNIALIAVGITFSPLLEVVAVALFTVAVVVFAGLALRRAIPRLPRLPGVLLAVACCTLFASMALALAYGYSAFRPAEALVGIGTMIRWHGALNAFGFAVPALLAFRLLD
ncbi:YndJ family transporter [Haloglomus litoreum]|uniref:YndJ family transporter n=1 Tax=Haloglomus litoreum TaxID=3034026 RepID=UPI0023E845A8|nr:YndJ family transporter [Haloglomus sp. DT116]